MNLDNAVWLLTGLAAVVVLLTRMRLSAEDQQSGHAVVPLAIVNAHTPDGRARAGRLDLLPDLAGRRVGVVALAAWWIEVVIGLLILARWLPRHGKHAADATGDSWAQGPDLSILGHIGMLLGIAFFTWVVLADKISA